MALSSAIGSVSRDKSPSRSPLSPTIIHYHQKYQITKLATNDHLQKQHIRNFSRQHYQNQRKNRTSKRRQSPSLWEVHRSSNGQIYYYNVVTDKSQWEKPPRKRFSSSITTKSIHSKRISNKNNLNKMMKSDDDFYHHKRRKDNIEVKSSFKKFRKDQRKPDKMILSTPTSPPENEKIQIDLVDPIPTLDNSNINISISFINSQQSHHSKRSIKSQINSDLSSTIIQSSLYPSESTINAILELEHSPPIKRQCLSPIWSTITNLNSNHIIQYYRAELIEHLLNWPSTQIEREAIRLLNEQIRFTTCQLVSLRTDLFSIRLQFERNRFQLLKYDYLLVNQRHLIDKLRITDSDQI